MQFLHENYSQTWMQKYAVLYSGEPRNSGIFTFCPHVSAEKNRRACIQGGKYVHIIICDTRRHKNKKAGIV